MDYQEQYKCYGDSDKAALPTEFLAVCIIAFIAGVSATAYFCRSMSYNMKMPGGWAMSMMWMRMPGQTLFASTLSFLFMWLAMMVAMMLPSALPMFIKTRQKWTSLCYTASGYFVIWLIAGFGVYVPGMIFMKVAMQSESFSLAVPLLSGALLIAVGAIQFTRWKMIHLSRCRSSFRCTISSAKCETGFRLGCKQGIACCVCCIPSMTILLVLGIMNSLAMIVVTVVIAAEKMLPRPKITSRVVGIASILAGGIIIVSSL